MPFRNFGFEDEILRAIQKAGYTRPTPVQAAAIPKVMQGDDLIAIAQTGTGKTAAFVLPMLHRLTHSVRGNRGHRETMPQALILAPTRELAVQIMENIRSYGANLPIRVAAIYGGVDEAAQIKVLRKGEADPQNGAQEKDTESAGINRFETRNGRVRQRRPSQ